MAEIVVSVVIPAYNAAAWLPTALESASRQSLREIEILVVDDGSTDETADIVREHAARDPRIQLIQRQNGGVGAARNTGIQRAKGRFIAPLDADDVWMEEKLEAQLARIEAGGVGMGLVYCWLEKIDDHGDVVVRAPRWDIEGRVLGMLILRNFIGNASVPLFRREALEKVGGYLELDDQGGAQGCEDWDLSIRVAEHYSLGVVARPLAQYRQVASAMSLRADSMARSYQAAMQRAQARNPQLSAKVFQWSAGNFHGYLVSKCYHWGDYRSCISSICRAIRADTLFLTRRKLYAMGAKSLLRVITGTRANNGATRPGPTSLPEIAAIPPAARRSLFDRVQRDRWNRVRKLDERAGSR